jgi:hypothetical protein
VFRHYRWEILTAKAVSIGILPQLFTGRCLIVDCNIFQDHDPALCLERFET